MLENRRWDESNQQEVMTETREEIPGQTPTANRELLNALENSSFWTVCCDRRASLYEGRWVVHQIVPMMGRDRVAMSVYRK